MKLNERIGSAKKIGQASEEKKQKIHVPVTATTPYVPAPVVLP
jgi:hypothetical protein